MSLEPLLQIQGRLGKLQTRTEWQWGYCQRAIMFSFFNPQGYPTFMV